MIATKSERSKTNKKEITKSDCVETYKLKKSSTFIKINGSDLIALGKSEMKVVSEWNRANKKWINSIL